MFPKAIPTSVAIVFSLSLSDIFLDYFLSFNHPVCITVQRISSRCCLCHQLSFIVTCTAAFSQSAVARPSPPPSEKRPSLAQSRRGLSITFNVGKGDTFFFCRAIPLLDHLQSSKIHLSPCKSLFTASKNLPAHLDSPSTSCELRVTGLNRVLGFIFRRDLLGERFSPLFNSKLGSEPLLLSALRKQFDPRTRFVRKQTLDPSQQSYNLSTIAPRKFRLAN